MSADNGVYVLKSPTASNPKEFEYRVAYAMAIDNIYFGNENTEEGRRENDESRLYLFGKSTVFLDPDKAFEEAERIHSQYEWTEYGITQEEIARPFPN
jgi:hypothetical protein